MADAQSPAEPQTLNTLQFARNPDGLAQVIADTQQPILITHLGKVIGVILPMTDAELVEHRFNDPEQLRQLLSNMVAENNDLNADTQRLVDFARESAAAIGFDVQLGKIVELVRVTRHLNPRASDERLRQMVEIAVRDAAARQ